MSKVTAPSRPSETGPSRPAALGLLFSIVMSIYILIHAAYSTCLKNIALPDVFSVASGFAPVVPSTIRNTVIALLITYGNSNIAAAR